MIQPKDILPTTTINQPTQPTNQKKSTNQKRRHVAKWNNISPTLIILTSSAGKVILLTSSAGKLIANLSY